MAGLRLLASFLDTITGRWSSLFIYLPQTHADRRRQRHGYFSNLPIAWPSKADSRRSRKGLVGSLGEQKQASFLLFSRLTTGPDNTYRAPRLTAVTLRRSSLDSCSPFRVGRYLTTILARHTQTTNYSKYHSVCACLWIFSWENWVDVLKQDHLRGKVLGASNCQCMSLNF